MREGRQHAHQPGIKQVARHLVILAQALVHRVLRQLFKQLRQRQARGLGSLVQAALPQRVQQAVYGKDTILGGNQLLFHSIFHQPQQISVHIFGKLLYIGRY